MDRPGRRRCPGVYIARLVRDDTGGASQIPFVVRDDAASSDMLVKTSDATWQAYNKYGGNSLYSCTSPCPPGNPWAYKGAFSVSYNRPFDGTITQDTGRSYLFYAEYQMIRFIERNGYDASYTSQADVAANAALLLNHKLIISSGHDEYWSGAERPNVEAARDAGVSLAFFSGNEVFWKTRWQSSSADGTATQYRTLTTYKDTHFDARDRPGGVDGHLARPAVQRARRRRTPAELAHRPAVHRQLGLVGHHRARRRTRTCGCGATPPSRTSAPGQSRTLAPGNQMLGYEWDIDADNGFRPRGQFQLSSTTVSGVESFTDYGTSTQQGTTQTHHLTMYRAPSGALVFGAGTVQWAWGLDTTNAWNNNGPPAGASADPVMQQATVNLFADMGAQATTLMSGLVAASASTDTTAPNSTITSPAQGAVITDGARVTISGTATDAGGTVAGVEVSTDGGTTLASGHRDDVVVLQLDRARRAEHDDHGARGRRQRQPRVVLAERQRQRRLPVHDGRPERDPVTIVDQQDPSAVEVGVKFKADLDGTITGVRFYKATANTGTHIGNLWTANGTLLARGTFSGETRLGLAAADVLDAGGHHRGDDLRRVVLRAARALLGVVRLLLRAEPVRRQHARQPAAARHQREQRRRQRRLLLRGRHDVPDVHLQRRELRGRRRLHAEAPAGRRWARSRPRPARAPRPSASARRPPAACPSRYIVTPFIGSTAQPSVTVQGSPPATSTTVSGLDPGDLVHLQGPGRQRQRHRPALGGVQRGHADRADGSGRPDRPRRQRRQPPGDRALDRAQRRRPHDHALHRHAVPRRRRAGDDLGDRIAGADDRGRDRA